MKNLLLADTAISRRRRTPAAEQIRWVQAWERSDLTQEAFAQAHDLKVGTLRNWVRHYDQRSTAEPDRVELQEIQLDQVLARAQPTASVGWELEIRLPSGLAIAVAPGTSASRLRELLEAVRC